MSFSTVLRQRCCSASSARRYVSTNATKKVQSHRMLPDAKMRALIALYHQSENFITLENLDERIDQAFVPQTKLSETVARQTLTLKDMEVALEERRDAPRLTDWNAASSMPALMNEGLNWSSWKTAREYMVVEALYGTSSAKPGEMQPGLEVLEDSNNPPVTVIPEQDLADALKSKIHHCHAEYPPRFNIDRESRMLGSIKAYRRQVIISTGKTDWDREVTETKGSLASYLSGAEGHASLPISDPAPPSSPTLKGPKAATRTTDGVYNSKDSTKISILNGSYNTMSEDADDDTVLIFPDYTIVADVSRSREGAQKLWESAVDPSVKRGDSVLEKSPFKTWVLPYSCVILLCSHKKRDNRCALSAPKLESAFIHSLQENGWAADTQLECHCLMGNSIEDLRGTPEETNEYINKMLHASANERRALIIKTSHIGGHKYAGNCIIYTPQGSSVWYGRVSPHEVPSIVTNTIINGLVLPPLLRGGLNISRPGCKSLNDW